MPTAKGTATHAVASESRRILVTDVAYASRRARSTCGVAESSLRFEAPALTTVSADIAVVR